MAWATHRSAPMPSAALLASTKAPLMMQSLRRTERSTWTCRLLQGGPTELLSDSESAMPSTRSWTVPGPVSAGDVGSKSARRRLIALLTSSGSVPIRPSDVQPDQPRSVHESVAGLRTPILVPTNIDCTGYGVDLSSW